MVLHISGVDKLAGNEAVVVFLRQLLRLGDGALHALGALAEYQLRAVGTHQLPPLHAHGLRHHNDDTVATGGRHGGKTDARIAGGRLNNNGVGF